MIITAIITAYLIGCLLNWLCTETHEEPGDMHPLKAFYIQYFFWTSSWIGLAYVWITYKPEHNDNPTTDRKN